MSLCLTGLDILRVWFFENLKVGYLYILDHVDVVFGAGVPSCADISLGGGVQESYQEAENLLHSRCAGCAGRECTIPAYIYKLADQNMVTVT